MNVAVRSKSLDILSICTGGGGLDLGIELAVQGARSVCMVEREAYAVAQLVSAMEAGHLAPAPIWSDARTFNGRAWRGAVDGLIGGIPCQPHSLAGRKRGQNDERDLWSDARRIVVQSGAWFALIENVTGMLSAGDDEIAGAQRVWRDLSKLGFEVEGGLFTAAEVGAPHQRERIFILAVADPDRRQSQGRAAISGEALGGRSYPQSAGSGAWLPSVGLADANSERLEGVGPDAGEIGRPDAGRSAGLRDGTTLVHAERSERRPHLVGGHEPDRKDGGRDQEASGAGEPSQLVEHAESIGRGKGRSEPSVRGGWSATAQPIGLFPPGPSDLSSWRDTLERAPELEPAFRRVADGLASRLDIARVDRLRLLGNGVVPLEGAYAFRTLVTRLAARGSVGAARVVRMMERDAA